MWLRQPDFGLSADHFADAASASIQDRYNDYARQQEGVGQTQQPGVTGPTEVEISGKRIYLCFRAEDAGAADLLNTLDRYNAKATFFCTTDFLEQQDDLLRRMTGSGHGVGILAEGEEADALEQLSAGNRALARATGQKTRLARLENAGEETLEAARAAGYWADVSALKASRYTLSSSGQANLLFQSVSTSRGLSCLWMGNEVASGGLSRFLSLAAGAEDPCLALTETTDIS